MDKKFAPNWHCIMGGSLGFEVALLVFGAFFFPSFDLPSKPRHISGQFTSDASLSGCLREALVVVHVLWGQCGCPLVQILNKRTILIRIVVIIPKVIKQHHTSRAVSAFETFVTLAAAHAMTTCLLQVFEGSSMGLPLNERHTCHSHGAGQCRICS